MAITVTLGGTKEVPGQSWAAVDTILGVFHDIAEEYTQGPVVVVEKLFSIRQDRETYVPVEITFYYEVANRPEDSLQNLNDLWASIAVEKGFARLPLEVRYV